MRYGILAIMIASSLYASLDNTTCVKCHPKIFAEYQHSAHRQASIYLDPIHKAIWDRHPAKKKGNYKCAKCHTPRDKAVVSGSNTLTKTPIQTQEPISCQTCHQIESIQEHKKANKNIYTKEKKTFFAADKTQKGTTLHYHDKSSFFGLFKTRVGSPYHDINYSNENFYNGGVCLGCHDHKANGKGFLVCDMQIKEKEGYKENCITCHMPKIKGPFVNQKKSPTHRYHGKSALIDSPKYLGKYVVLRLQKEADGYAIMIENKANHTLASQPLRLSKLRIFLVRDGKERLLQEEAFTRVIGTDKKPSPPWLATETLKDTLIKAFEKRQVKIDASLHAGDELVVQFGYHIVNPKMAKKLGLDQEKFTKFVVLSKGRFKVQ